MTVKKDPSERSKVQMISLALKLVNEKVPVVVLFQHQGKVKTYGSKHILDVVQDMLKNNECGIINAVERDTDNLADIENCDDPLIESKFDINNTSNRGKAMFKHGGDIPVLQPLPYPLSILNFKETIHTLREYIVHDKVERTGMGGGIKFGDPDWEPSFWPNHLWKWTDVKFNFKNLAAHHFPSSKLMGLRDFYKLCLKQCLENSGLDPERFYSSRRTKEELEHRQGWYLCRQKSSDGKLKKFSIENKEEIVDDLSKNVYFVDETNSDDLDDFEEEKFKEYLEAKTTNIFSDDEKEAKTTHLLSEDENVELDEFVKTTHSLSDDENVGLDEFVVIQDKVYIETISKKRKSEDLLEPYQPPIRRSSVICYNLN
eukprot:GFUD01045019.1.p1 GENE.GFUD01045019.1~~GFUD01045019.1.p1  ORF type:complete len:372 (-),score=104.92 GFUD01045019.1:10-1125(-)